MDETPKNVIQALAAVMRNLPGIGKGDRSEQGYYYRGIEAITSEVQPLLGRYGVVFVPQVVSREVRELTINNKPWTEDHLVVSYTVYGPGGVEDHIVVGPVCGLGRDNSDKGANKAMTQAFKYALIQTLCIGDAKDDGDREAAHEADVRPAVPAGFVAVGAAKAAMVTAAIHAGQDGSTARLTASDVWRWAFQDAKPELVPEGLLASLKAKTALAARVGSSEAPESPEVPTAEPEAVVTAVEVPTMATAAQVKRIHTITSALGMPDSVYRGKLVERYGVGSSTELTTGAADDLIKRLTQLQRRAEQPPSAKSPVTVAREAVAAGIDPTEPLSAFSADPFALDDEAAA